MKNTAKFQPFATINFFKKLILSASVCIGMIPFVSWNDGPLPDCKSDSLAIVRVVKPISDMFHIKPAVFVSKGLCKIDRVSVSDNRFLSGDLAVRQTLSDLLSNGFTIQSTTESIDGGMQLNTYYLKKKVG